MHSYSVLNKLKILKLKTLSKYSSQSTLESNIIFHIYINYIVSIFYLKNRYHYSPTMILKKKQTTKNNM